LATAGNIIDLGDLFVKFPALLQQEKKDYREMVDGKMLMVQKFTDDRNLITEIFHNTFDLHSSILITLELSFDNINVKSADQAVHISLRIWFTFSILMCKHAGRSFIVPQNHLLEI